MLVYLSFLLGGRLIVGDPSESEDRDGHEDKWKKPRTDE